MHTFTSRLFHYPRLKALDVDVHVLGSYRVGAL
jgi:hypothetical protein